MSQPAGRLGRAKSKTWSTFGNIGKKPSEYEIVTHNMNHTFGGDGPPLEMGPEVKGNIWIKANRDACLFSVKDWNGFRDPDKVTYRKYCTVQDEQETYVDGLLAEFTDVKSSDAHLPDATLQFLQLAVTPTRYLVHVQQMMSAYIQQLSPSTYVANCASFQTADAVRRVQRIAYRTKQLEIAHPLRGFGSFEREVWENDENWQPIRKAAEGLLIKYRWDEVVAAFQFTLRPVLDNLFLNQMSLVSKTLGAELDSLIAANLYIDSQRANRWSIALARFVKDQNAEGFDRLRALVNEQYAVAESVISAGARLLSQHLSGVEYTTYEMTEEGRVPTITTEAIAFVVREDWRAFLNEAGLTFQA